MAMALAPNCNCNSGLAVFADESDDRKLSISICWPWKLASARALVHLSPSAGPENLQGLVWNLT